MQTKSPIEINLEEFSHRASIYLLRVASTYHVTPDEALKVILETVSKHIMLSGGSAPSQGTLTKDDVKAWLKATKRNRQWLADQCFVKKPAVDKWFEKGRDIPNAKAVLIKKLMIMEGISKRMVPASEATPKRRMATKEDVKTWLKTTGQDREWLAEKCYVTKPTVNGWFRSTGIIPPAKLALIQRLMEEGQAANQITRKEVCHA